MKIIITKTFLYDFKDIFYDDKFLKIFLRKLNETKLIFLENELYKFKFYIKTISIRGIIFMNIQNNFIPILIAKKSDKNIGANLVLNKQIKKIIDIKFKKMSKDLANGNYEIL